MFNYIFGTAAGTRRSRSPSGRHRWVLHGVVVTLQTRLRPLRSHAAYRYAYRSRWLLHNGSSMRCLNTTSQPHARVATCPQGRMPHVASVLMYAKLHNHTRPTHVMASIVHGSSYRSYAECPAPLPQPLTPPATPSTPPLGPPLPLPPYLRTSCSAPCGRCCTAAWAPPRGSCGRRRVGPRGGSGRAYNMQWGLQVSWEARRVKREPTWVGHQCLHQRRRRLYACDGTRCSVLPCPCNCFATHCSVPAASSNALQAL